MVATLTSRVSSRSIAPLVPRRIIEFGPGVAALVAVMSAWLLPGGVTGFGEKLPAKPVGAETRLRVTGSAKPLIGFRVRSIGNSEVGVEVAAHTLWSRLVPVIVKVCWPLHVSKRNEPMRVLQLPPAGSYMPVNQNVQPSTGSTPIWK